jgi:hypothetical protein
MILRLLLGLMALGLCANAYADTSNNFDYTGTYATDFIDVGWVPQTAPAPGLGAGSAQDWSAIAGQFTVPSETQMSALTIDANILPFDNPPAQTTPVTFELVQGDSTGHHLGNQSLPVPGDNVVLSSSTFDFTSSGASQNVHQTVPFSFDLQPHTSYWIEGTGNGGASVLNIREGFISPSITQNTAQTPEPPLWIFFLALAGYVLLKRKKHVALERVV